VGEVVRAESSTDRRLVLVRVGVVEVWQECVDDIFVCELGVVIVLTRVRSVHWVVKSKRTSETKLSNDGVRRDVEDIHHVVILVNQVVAMELVVD